MENIKIGTREVGNDRPCFIIAEAGVNHNSSLETAKKLVDAALEAGVDAVKFQTFKSEDLVTAEDGMAEYQQQNLGKRESQQEMLRKLELGFEDFKELKKYCDEKGIIFLTTPHTGGETLDFVNGLVPAFKVGSGELTNHPFLEDIAGKGKPIFLATGMGTMQEVQNALEVIYKAGNREVIALHCTSSYPCDLKHVNLRAMLSMKEELDCLVGFSGHSSSVVVPIAACALGACLVEKHFTLDKSMPGPDHLASLDPKELRQVVQGIRKAESELRGKALKPEELGQVIENVEDVEIALGSPEKKPTTAEEDIAKHARKSIVARRRIENGETISAEMLAIKRPGTGMKPFEIQKLLGKKAKRSIAADELISFGMVE